MEFTVTPQNLMSILQPIIGILPQRSTLPILSHLLLEVETGTLSTAATDLEVSILSKLPVSVSTPGAIALPGKKFVEIIRELPSDFPVTIEVEKGVVTISCNIGTYRILGLPKEDFPRLPEEPSSGRKIDMRGMRFRRMIDKTIFATSKDETRPTLNGVLWEIKTDVVRMVATDGHRLARMSYYGEGQEQEKGVIIPHKALSLLQRFISEDIDLNRIVIGENHIIFFLSNLTVFSRLIEGPFPLYEEVIPQNNDKRLIVDKNILIASLRRVSILADPITHLVRFSLEPERIRLFASNQELGGEAQEEIPAEYHGESMNIGYNAQYILEALRQIDHERVIFLLGSPLGAGIISPLEQTEGEEYFYLIMPIRLTD